VTGVLQWLTNLFQGVKLWIVVRPWERAIRVRLGKHAVELGPGVHIRIPIVDEAILFNNRLRIAAFPGQTLTTQDGRAVSVAGNVGFRVEQPLEAMRALQQPEYSCAALVQSSVAAYISSRNFGEIDAADLQSYAKDELVRMAGGLAIEYVSVTDFALVNRTFRVLGDEWRPATRPDSHDKFSE
jgi:regulator of protease activity HflC (stomatin/prohibitin superfamily)